MIGDGGDLLIGELRLRGHAAVEDRLADFDLAGQAERDDARQIAALGEQLLPVRALQRRGEAGGAAAVGLVAGSAGLSKHAGAARILRARGRPAARASANPTNAAGPS